MAKNNKVRSLAVKKAPQPIAPSAPARVSTEVQRLGGWVRRHYLWLTLLAMTLLAYLPALRAGYIWDDQALMQNPLIFDPAGFWKLWLQPSLNVSESHYWPMVYSTFWLEFRLWGWNPIGYHAVNIMLHGSCVILLWRLLARLRVPGDWLAAVLFALHPVHVESVAWVIERKDVLSGVFYLGAALAYLHFESTRRKEPYLLALLLFAAAMLSKSIVISLPLALGLVLWWRQGRLGWRDLAPLLPLALVAAVLTFADLHRFRDIVVLDDHTHLTLPERLQLSGQAIWFYLGKLVWPHPLVMFYPKWTISAGALSWLPLGGGIAVFVTLLATCRRLGRGPLAAAIFFVLTLGPILGLVKYGFMELAWVANRFQYLASIGPLVLFAAVLHKFLKNSARSAVVMILLLACAALTWRQAVIYQDVLKVSQHCAAVYPNNWFAHFLVGSAYNLKVRHAESVAAFREAQRLKPGGCYEVSYRLAKGLDRLGRTQEALDQFKDMLRLKPDYPEGRNDFGAFLFNRNHPREALEQLQEALRLRPHYSDALSNMGGALLKMGRKADAEKYIREAVAARPQSAQFHFNLAMVLLEQNKRQEGIDQLREATALDPSMKNAHNILMQLSPNSDSLALSVRAALSD